MEILKRRKWSLILPFVIISLAAAIAALYPVFIYFSNELLIVSLIVLLDVLMIVMLLRADESPSRGRWFAAGLVAGVSTIARPSVLIFLPALFGWMWWRSPGGPGSGGRRSGGSKSGDAFRPAVVRFESSSYAPKGHSAQFSGTARCVADPATCCPGAMSCPASYAFEADVDVLVANPGTPAVNGVRTFQEITSDPRTLTITFDPAAWWKSVDFARLAASEDGSGGVRLEPSDPDYSALVIAMTANELPDFTWTADGADP